MSLAGGCRFRWSVKWFQTKNFCQIVLDLNSSQIPTWFCTKNPSHLNRHPPTTASTWICTGWGTWLVWELVCCLQIFYLALFPFPKLKSCRFRWEGFFVQNQVGIWLELRSKTIWQKFLVSKHLTDHLNLHPPGKDTKTTSQVSYQLNMHIKLVVYQW